ncbi:ABC transporter ATP-binding protein [Clostridium sp. D2Q-14]|uniref:ABC transporter ATP-binding protein n=1 Tax=Anaeromonas gelatinilytica TaxID=2683194 RepID=UPI00193BC528|nr:ABC transporter ATP-binding protein [Anaeromonas gelatinilytica]MBS4534845.1 ABC transporter ATP-binding protein [Anaeromonas gelatinilytica]
MIKIVNLNKRYNNKVFMKDINTKISSGEITLLCGRNGAGKSTLMKCISGLINYSGEIQIDSHNNKSIISKRKLGYIPETPEIYEDLTVWDHIEFNARIYKIDDWKSKAEKLCKDFNLLAHKDKLGTELSKGMLQKTNIIMTLIHNPDTLLIDEPFVGLDPQSIDQLKKYMLMYKNHHKTLIVSTHILDSMNLIWDRAIILGEGQILSDIRYEELNSRQLSEYFLELTDGSKGIDKNE